MKDFKEWLSDYLRYIMLLLAAVLVFFLALIGVRIYQHSRQPEAQDVIEVYPESETESSAESEAEPESESKPETEAETVAKPVQESEKRTETESETTTAPETKADSQTQPETKKPTETTERSSGFLPEDGTGVTIVRQTEAETKPDAKTQPTTEKNAQTETETQRQTEPPTEPPTEAPTEPPEPVYMTLTGSCYIRSGPGYEYDIIGEYMYGTVVQVLDDSSGWYKVQVDGMTGYMGSRFFH